MIRTRKNIWSLQAGDETLMWYGRGIAEMQKKLIAEPTSWRFQSAIHEYFRSEDPLATNADKLPSAADQKKFWTQCQHTSWYFLPWHRMYLHHFESILLGHIVQLGGPKDWALPYWNYSPSAQTRLLPPAFRDPKLSGGAPNALYVAERDPLANAGKAFASAVDTDIQQCLARTKYPAVTGGSAGFGGPVTKFEHGNSNNVFGAVERVPHGTMHVQVGGQTGWMGNFTTAPLDPIFWVHHCNIDRLWEVWLKRDPSHVNPSTSNWLTSVSFAFHDATGKVVTMTPSQVLDTTATPLEYVYDDTSDPLPHPPAAVPGAKGATKAIVTTPQPIPEKVGATGTATFLSNVPTEVSFSTHAPTGPAMLDAARPHRRVFLHIEHITSTVRAAPYDVYLNLPPKAAPEKHPELHAGRLPMFGLVEASRPNDKHPANGLHYSLEVTDIYAHLAAAPGWDAQKVRVSFVPTRADGAREVAVGQVSLNFA